MGGAAEVKRKRWTKNPRGKDENEKLVKFGKPKTHHEKEGKKEGGTGREGKETYL